MSKHIVYTATPHGFGHAAILTSIMASVAVDYPDVRQTIVTDVPEQVLRERFSGPYAVVPHRGLTDFGMLMSSSTQVRISDTLARYRAVHERSERDLLEWRGLLERLRPSLVVSSASYVAITAAAALKVPAVTVGPFLWHDILQAYAPDAGDVLAVMADAYQKASAFLLTAPHVPPTVIGPERLLIGPVGLGGSDRRGELFQRGVLRRKERVVFASLGGMGEAVPYACWSCPPGWRLLTPEDGRHLGISVGDLIASSSAVVTKPGYGTYVEAALAGVCLISRARPDWPESVGLLGWYRDQGLPVHEVPEESFSGPGPLAILSAPEVSRGPLAGRYSRFGRITSGADLAADILFNRYLS